MTMRPRLRKMDRMRSARRQRKNSEQPYINFHNVIPVDNTVHVDPFEVSSSALSGSPSSGNPTHFWGSDDAYRDLSPVLRAVGSNVSATLNATHSGKDMSANARTYLQRM